MGSDIRWAFFVPMRSLLEAAVGVYAVLGRPDIHGFQYLPVNLFY